MAKPLGHGLDLIDRHIDLKRRVSRLEATKLGRDAVKALRSRHPFPIAEHLCISSSMPTDAFRAGQVARFIAAREQESSDIKIHRLLRIMRERLNINRWIGNQGTIHFGHPADSTSIIADLPGGIPPWTGDLFGLQGGVPGAPPRNGAIQYTQYGNWVYPWLLPGTPRIRKHISKVTMANDHFRTPDAALGGGVIWPNINVKWLAWPHERPFGIGGSQYFPVDAFVLGNGVTALPQEFGYSRGPSYDWAPDPAPPHTALVVVRTYDEFRGDAPYQLTIDTEDKILSSVPHTDRTTTARTVQPDDWYSEDSSSYTSLAYYFPTDQLKAAGKPFLLGDGHAPQNYGSDAYERAWTQASFADVALNHYGELSAADMAPLLTWYEQRLDEVPAGEWLADAALAPVYRQEEPHITYDHRWTDIAHDGGASGLPYMIGQGEGEWLLRNGQVHLRGVLMGSDFVGYGPAAPTVPQWIVLIGASGAVYHTSISASGVIHNAWTAFEPYVHLDGVSYHID